MKGQGVNVFNKDGTSRGIQDITVDTISKVGGNDMAKKTIELNKIYGKEGIAAVSSLITTYKESFQKSKAGGASDTQAAADAQTALRAEMEKNINVASSWSEVQKDAAQAQSTASAQLGVAWEKVKAAVGEKVTPALILLAPKVAELVPAIALVVTALGTMIDWMKTIPALSALFKDKEAKKRQEDELQNKIDARAASPEHLAFDLDEDPVLNDLINQQNEQAQKDKIKAVHDKDFSRMDTSDQILYGLNTAADSLWTSAGVNNDKMHESLTTMPNQYTPSEMKDKAKEIDNAELAKNSGEAAKNLGTLAELLGNLGKDHPHSAKW